MEGDDWMNVLYMKNIRKKENNKLKECGITADGSPRLPAACGSVLCKLQQLHKIGIASIGVCC